MTVSATTSKDADKTHAIRRPVIVYDGDCPFCRKQIIRIHQRDVSEQFEYLPRQTPGLTNRFPRLTEGDFNTGMRLVMQDGEIHVGADAVYHIARRLPVWRWLAWLYRIPVLHRLMRRTYGWIAANRRRLARTCEDGACRLDS